MGGKRGFEGGWGGWQWMFSGSVLGVLKTKTEFAVPENIHTPPHRRDWKFLGGGGGVLKGLEFFF